MPNITTPETPEERRRRRDREYVAAKRAAMSEQERAARRRQHDAVYRERHRDERRQYDLQRHARLRGGS